MKFSKAAGGAALVAFALGFWLRGSELAQVGGGDPPARLAVILHLPEANPRASRLVDFFARVNPKHLYDLREVMRTERDHVDELAEVLFAAWWARFDPQGALEGRMSPHWSGRYPWIRTVMREWARQGPENALQAVRTMDQQQIEPTQVAVNSLIRGWFDNEDVDPMRLLDVIEGLESVKARGDAVSVFLNTMIDSRGAPATEQFLENMEERSYGFKTDFFGRYGASMARRDPANAVSWAQKHANEPHGKKILWYLSARWGYEDGPAAMEWVTTLPHSETNMTLVERSYRSFMMQDRDGARAWMTEQTPTPELESAYALFLLGTAKDDPERALELANQIQDEKQRIRVQTKSVRAWMNSDVEAAKAWLKVANLSPQVVAAILKPQRKRGSAN